MIFLLMKIVTAVLVVMVVLAALYALGMQSVQKPVATREKAKTMDDNEDFLEQLSEERGQPLVAYYDYTKKELDNDPFIEELPRLSVPCEERGLVLGVSGTGKTSYLVAQLVDWMQSGKSFVVTDVKPEIWAILQTNGVFERYGYEDIVINPTDPNALAYNPFEDINSPSDIDELLFIIIPRDSSDGAVFKDNARRLMKAIMHHLLNKKGVVSLPAMREYRYKSGDMKMLMEKLKGSESLIASNLARDILDTAQNDNFFASILSSFNESLDFLANEVIHTNLSSSDVSLQEKLIEPRKAVFLQFAEADKGKTYKLFGVMLSHTLRLLQLNHRQRDDVFIAIDEIMNSAPILDLPNRLNVMRSAKMPLFMYLQTIKGLDALYGREEANMMLSACNFKLCYRVNDIETAKMFSDMAGETEVFSTSVSRTPDMNSQGREQIKTTSSMSVSTDRLINPEELLQMPAECALGIFKGAMGLVGMPVYYKNLPMPVRNEYGTISEFLEYEKQEEIEEVL